MFSKLAFSLMLASLLTTMVASNSNFGKNNMIVMQSANAVSNITPIDNPTVDCQEFDAGTATFDCELNVKRDIDIPTQIPGNAQNLYDVISNVTARNDCDEFDDGDLLVTCTINAADLVNIFVGPVVQTSDDVGNNEIDIETNDILVNICDESGIGNDQATCTIDWLNSIDSITQENIQNVNNANDAGFVLDNTADIFQSQTLVNDCDEFNDGDNLAVCNINFDNLIGPITQTNDVSGDTPNDFHINNFDASQQALVVNDCSESSTGNNEAGCDATHDDSSNDIDAVIQLNQVTDADSAAQINNATLFQALVAQNSCDEVAVGVNDPVQCIIDNIDNEIDQLS